MKLLKIKIDQETDSFLESQSKNFDETRNMTIKRLLNIGGSKVSSEVIEKQEITRKKKMPKTSLRTLVANGYLNNGEKLYFRDYQKSNKNNYEAILSNNKIKFNGTDYSMSALAKQLLKTDGHKSGAVAGPRHWCNKDGVSVSTLWKQYLKSKSN